MKISAGGLLFVALTIIFTVVGQLLVKRGTQVAGVAPTQASQLPRYAVHVMTNPLVVLGLLAAVVAAVAWTIAVSKTALSVAYPFMALAIVLVLTLSNVSLGERLSVQAWVGVGFVCLGLVITSRG